MRSFYHLVNITRDQLPEKDYESILIAYDDSKGRGIEYQEIKGPQLIRFMENGVPIHFEKMFMTDKVPHRVVYWAYSKTRGWAERVEIKL